MVNSIYEQERYSICMVHAETGGSKTYYKYYRIADYDPAKDRFEIYPALVERDAISLEEVQANPDHLYNPTAAYNHDKRSSDVYLFQWRLDPNEIGRQLTISFFDDLSLGKFPKPREVIIPDGVKSEHDLRIALQEGIPFEGKSTSTLYIAYEHQDGSFLAIQLEQRDLVFKDGLMRLSNSVGNVRSTVMSAACVRLAECDIIESPHAANNYRKLYARMDDLPSEGSILLRPLSYFADDYVKWFIRDASINATKSDRRRLGEIIDLAFSRPDTLEEYLGANVDEEEVAQLRNAVKLCANQQGDAVRKYICDALLEDDSFGAECIDIATENYSDEIDELKNEIKNKQAERDELSQELDTLEDSLNSIKEETSAANDELDAKRKEILKLNEDYCKAETELQNNLALKLGLGIVSNGQAASGQGEIIYKKGLSASCRGFDGDVAEAFEENLRRLGVLSALGDSDEDRRIAVASTLAGLSATKLLLVPNNIAYELADALSIAVSGNTADRAFVPADCRDLAGITKLLPSQNEVLVLDNLIDPVNEGALLSVVANEAKGIVVLPFSSHASLALVARETLAGLFMPAVESLVSYPVARRVDRLVKSSEDLELPLVNLDDAIEGLSDLRDELSDVSMPVQSLLTSVVAMYAAEEILGDESVERVVSQYLAIACEKDISAIENIEKWTEEDTGIGIVKDRIFADAI